MGVLSKYADPVICNYDLSKFGASVAIAIHRYAPAGNYRWATAGEPVFRSSRAVPRGDASKTGSQH